MSIASLDPLLSKKNGSVRLFFLMAFGLVAAVTRADPPVLPEASWDKLPAWHGFNLLEKFHLDWSNGPYKEDDFRLMADYGFNFARLPMDYRTYIKGGDWLAFDEAVLAEIDQAVAWGGQYGIHINLNLHRIPGYTVASPAEPTSLWTDPATQAVAAAHWRMFATRYRGISNSRLSFNLLNEPAGTLTGSEYAAVVKVLADAIREEDPERLIIADGLDYATRPVPELIPLRVAQSKHGYEPFNLTHYQANWVDGSSGWPVPVWPGNGVSSYLYGPAKSGFQSALVITGPFEHPVRLRIRVSVVSDHGRLVVSTGDTTLLDHVFQPGPGEGEWETSVYREEWGIYQNIYNRDYRVDVPAGTSELTVLNSEGDWMTLSELGIQSLDPIGPEAILQPGVADWGSRQEYALTWRIDESEPSLTAGGGDRVDLWERHLQSWKDLEAQGVGVMVGEFGAYKRTPHPVVLAWLRDVLENYTIAGFGWSMWNFRGDFGPMNSGRVDVAYESVDGGKLDRQMMDLLQEFAGYRESYSDWASRVIPPGVEPSETGPEGDFDRDGLGNLAAYALGVDFPGNLGAIGPELDRDPLTGEWILRFGSSRRSVGMAFGLVSSSDLKTWVPMPDGAIRIEGVEGDHLVRKVRLSPLTDEPVFHRLTLDGPR